MDLSTLTSLAVQIRHRFKSVGVIVDGVVLFGSRARGTHRPDSDYDIAILSRDFGKDRYQEGILVNVIVHRVHPDFEAIPVGLRDWLDPFPTSPIVHEIKETGVTLI
jgi:predicted nucleotidyltransferase